MRQTSIQRGKITGKNEVKTSKLQDFFHKIEKTLSRVFRVSPTLLLAGIFVFMYSKGLAQEKIAHLGKSQSSYTQEVKKHTLFFPSLKVMKKYYDGGAIPSPDKLLEKMREYGLEPILKSDESWRVVAADNHPYIYIHVNGRMGNPNIIKHGLEI